MITMNVNQSIQINASPKKVFAVLNDLHLWEAWSPWVLAEPTAKITVAKDGKYHEWEGEIIGAGNLKIDHEKENELIEMSLHFLKLLVRVVTARSKSKSEKPNSPPVVFSSTP